MVTSGLILIRMWPDAGGINSAKDSRGGLLKSTMISVAVSGSALPARIRLARPPTATNR